MYQKNVVKENIVDLLLIEEKGKKTLRSYQNFNTFMYNHPLHHGKTHCLQVFSTDEILKHHIKDCFKINGKQRIIMSKKGEYVKIKNY